MSSNTLNETLGKRLQAKRRILGLSQQDLGKVLGVTFQQVQKYENGMNRLSAETLYKASKFLDTDIRYFYGEGADNPEGDNQHYVTPALQKAEEEILTEEFNREQLMLLRYYRRIESPEVRQRALHLIRSLAKLHYEETDEAM